jgi:drug/metabolite transporter (DMT)-like permease
MSRAGVKPIEDRSLAGIALILLAVTFFTGIDTCAKWLANAGMPQAVIVFVRFMVHFSFILVMIGPFHGADLFRSNNIRLEILRAITLLIATTANFIALRFLPLTVSSAIVFAMPLILTAISGPLLGEHVGWRRRIAVVVGFIGVLIIIRPLGGTVHWAALVLLLTPLASAFYYIASRKLAGVDSPYTQQVYAALVPALCTLPLAAFDWSWPTDGSTWFAFLAIGIFGGAGHLMLSMAHRLAPASTLAPFMYPQIILMSISSWLFFDQPPDLPVFIGSVLVVGSGIYIWVRENRGI